MAQVQQLTQAQQQAAQNQKISQANMTARQLILQQAFPMKQAIFAQTISSPENNTIINIPPQNVGLITGFLLKVSATVTAGTEDLTLTNFGPANLLQNILFTDLQNYQRINTPGWHLSAVNSAKQMSPFFSSRANTSLIGYGDNWPVIRAPATIGDGETGEVDMYFWVPLAYAKDDLTGAVFASVVNATMNLSVTLATTANAIVANTADPTLAVYQSAAAVGGATISNYTVTAYQMYYDQLPKINGNPLLPLIDISTIYEFKNTALTSIVQGQDFNIPFSNFRHFMSTCVIFDNQDSGSYPSPGSDVDTFSLRTANYTDAQKMDPVTWAAEARRRIGSDFPVPLYYFDHRDKPVYTLQQGNVNLVLKASTVNAGAKCLVGWEAFATVNNLVNAGSLASS